MVFWKNEIFTKIQHIKKWCNWSQLQRTDFEMPEFTTVANDEILLGASTRDYEDAVVIPYPKNRRLTIVIIGGQGSGKSILAKSIVYDNLHHRFGHPIFAIDPKKDSQRIRFPNTNPEFNARLHEYGINAKGYPHAKYIVPKFIDLEDALGKITNGEVTLSLRDFLATDKDTRVALMASILQIKQEETGFAVINKLMMRDTPPTTIADFKCEMLKIMDVKSLKSSRLGWKFDDLVDTKKLSDDTFEYGKELAKNKILIMEGTISDEDTSEYMTQGVITNIAIHNIISERKKSNNGNGCLNKIPVIFMDEASSFAGKGKMSAGIMTSLSTKYREINQKAGITSVVVSQFLHELAPKIVSEADYLIFPKINNANDIDILKVRPFDTYVLDNLHFDPNDRPNEWIVSGRNGIEDWQSFFPLPCASKMGSA